MSLQTAREMDPKIDDPVKEGNRVISEGLEKALLGGIEQQLAGGMLDPVVAAKIEIALRQDPTAHFADIYVKVHEDMQKQQAAIKPHPLVVRPACRLVLVERREATAFVDARCRHPTRWRAAPTPQPAPRAGQQNLAQLVSSLGQSSKPLAG